MRSDRHAALVAVHSGTVTARHLNVKGSPLAFEPRELQTAMGYLLKARLIQAETGYAASRARPVTLTVTERGNRALIDSATET